MAERKGFMSLLKCARVVFSLGLLAVVSGFAHAAGSRLAVLVVSNPTSLPRPEEVLEVPLSAVQSRLGSVALDRLQAEDLANHRALPVQLDATMPGAQPDRLLVLVSLAPGQSIRLGIREGKEATAAKPLVYGRAVPERKDDFAWENDKVAYRVYGPALQATGEIGSGIDVWSKRVPELVVNTWYSRDAEGQRTHNPALSYHRDSGQGLDSYDVGPTRGCGGTGIWNDGRLFVSKNYVSAEVLAGGPIRLRFRLRYAPWSVEGAQAAEEKIVTLDAGTHLNRIESTISLIGNDPERQMQWAAGLATHAGAHIIQARDKGILSVWEPLTDPVAGMDGTGIVLEPGAPESINLTGGNALVLLPASGVPVTYYAGAAWSKADIPDEVAWSRYLEAFRERLLHPLKTRWE
jgi:hypothetical protein